MPLAPRVFTLPAGAPFLPTLARALLSGALIPGFPEGGPLDLARATIYVPTQRAALALQRELVVASGKPSLILPRVAPLGAFEPTTEPEEVEPSRLEDRPAVGDLTRRMVLARLTRAWGEALRGAIRRVGADGRIVSDVREPPLVAASPAQALALAGDLAALIDDVIIEGLDWARLDRLAPEAFDPYWRITLDFLKIATAAWPEHLDERGLVDRAKRAAHRVEREIEALRNGFTRGPTIIAGSTGTNRAVARLIGAIARSPKGAVVLPDLDLDLDEESWSMIGGEDAAGHPQAALRRLLQIIEVPRAEVRELAAPPPMLKARGRLLGEALRPAESTHVWARKRDAIGEGDLEGVALIVADNEAEEALVLAIAMRAALETPGKTAALITPDPAIARRVSAELARWDIEVENSAGRTLGDTLAGGLARLALAAALDFAPLPIAALLSHPLARLGRERRAFTTAARALELAVLRAPPPPSGLADVDAAFAAARTAHGSRRAHPALKSLREENLSAAETLLRDLIDALAPLREFDRDAPLDEMIAAHRAALDALTNEAPFPPLRERGWGEGGGEALEELFDEWALASEQAFTVSLADYAALFETLLASTRAPPKPGGHPRLAILGLLEARLLHFDLALLAGLDETVWPPAAQTDAFLNRPMRAAFGLSPPERRIGQTAHDFTAALGAPEAVISRSLKRGGSPTVASRFWQRIGAVAGEAAMAQAVARGKTWLDYARALDSPDATTPIRRPEPRPKAALRPSQLSVTRIETLRRDPYAIYAERVLRLAPLDPIGAEVGPAEIGEVWHAALEAFAKGAVENEAPDDALARLHAIAEDTFAPLNADPAFRALRWPRILIGLDTFLGFDAERRELASQIWIESEGRLDIPLRDGSTFRLTARADRIDRLRDGGAALIDYKTGAPPGLPEVQVGFAPQLTLEAAILAAGGFAEIGALEATTAFYLKLGGADGGFVRELKFKDESFADVVERHFVGLKLLLEQFRDERTPYLSQPFPKFLGRGSDYDHLARVKEWSATGGFASGGGDET